MWKPLLDIVNFVIENFLHIWPYLLITIPLAVAVQLSGMSRYIERAFQARPIIAIFLATAVGAFSPFCSCTVIPVVASLLISGVPLAPVMAFWIASPSMDPEIFFLSVATLGWELALWRMFGTLLLSLSAGLITHGLMQRGWLGRSILRNRSSIQSRSFSTMLQAAWSNLQQAVSQLNFVAQPTPVIAEANCCGATTAAVNLIDQISATSTCDSGSTCSATKNANSSCAIPAPSFRQRLLKETWQATAMVLQFMALAFVLEAIIVLFVPETWIVDLLGGPGLGTVTIAALIGVPIYTSNLAALALVGGLLTQGMNPAAALAFLIAGPTTTLPAMAAVWGLTTHRVFGLYVSFALVGAVVLGMVYSLVS